MAKILAPTRYPWDFNGSRHSRHTILRRNFLPLNYISYKIEGVTAFINSPFEKVDLVHAFNRIPIGNTPYIIGFESHLPRCFGLEDTAYMNWLCSSLASPRCRGIFAISKFAEETMRSQLMHSSQWHQIEPKVQVRYPSVPEIKDINWDSYSSQSTLKVVFVGNHFARKGGLVALKLAELAHKSGFPLELQIVSKVQMGDGIWTDPTRKEFFNRYEKLFHLPNVNCLGGLRNDEVLALLGNADVNLLPTFGDTFGFSVIEAMAVGTPSIVTNQGALPEFVHHKKTGFLLEIKESKLGDPATYTAAERGSSKFEELYEAEVERLGIEALKVLQWISENRVEHKKIRIEAHNTCSKMFCPVGASEFWDSIYDGLCNVEH